jgi:two-component system chemotaxis sensor kinase CheA
MVEDNGGGVDFEAVRRVAAERGVLDEKTLARTSHEDLLELLFHPNMSTNREVTDISGRGVGLSAVRAFAQDVGGRAYATSPVSDGRGTRFTLDLPISLATVSVLIVESRGYTFAVPFANVVRTFIAPLAAISTAAGQETMEVDGETLPLLRLDEVLEITFGMPKHRVGDDLALVLMEGEDGRVVLAVDACVGEKELLVKALPPVLRGIRGFSGSTILPDGRTILLLDAHGLLALALGDILGRVSSSDGSSEDIHTTT